MRTHIGRWRLGEILGEGGMGAVYLAHHETLEIPAAAKLLSPKLTRDPKFRERFLREAKAQAQLRHPGIAQVLDYIEDNEDLCIVVEYLPGGNLEKRLEQGKPLPVESALTWARQALEALDHAHQRGIIHRDIKPSNIMLDEKEHAKVVDFGIALVLDGRRLTTATGSMGTPHYMSPEQIRRPRDLDHRTDVYSMGVVLYEMLAGRPPFDADSEYDIQAAQVNEAPKPLREINPEVPEELEAVVLQALEKNPDARFSGCGAFARALHVGEDNKAEVVVVEPPQPPPPPATRKLKRLAVVLGVAATLALGVALWLAVVLYKESRLRSFEERRRSAAQDRAESLHELAVAKSWNRRNFDISLFPFENGAVVAGGVQSIRWVSGGRYKWQATAQESPAFSDILLDSYFQAAGDAIYASVEIQSRESSPDGYGALVFRSNGNAFYSFRISGDRFSLWLHQNEIVEPLEDWRYSSAILSGSPNRLAVIAEGDRFAFYINDQIVEETYDFRAASGQIGIAVGFQEKGSSATFDFDNFELRKRPSGA